LTGVGEELREERKLENVGVPSGRNNRNESLGNERMVNSSRHPIYLSPMGGLAVHDQMVEVERKSWWVGRRRAVAINRMHLLPKATFGISSRSR
jgi:hypothetical protein